MYVQWHDIVWTSLDVLLPASYDGDVLFLEEDHLLSPDALLWALGSGLTLALARPEAVGPS